MALTEIEVDRWLRKIGPEHWEGHRTFQCADSSVRYYCDWLWNRAWEGFGGKNPPVCRRPTGTFHPQGLPGVAWILADYRSRRQPGKASIFTRPIHEPKQYHRVSGIPIKDEKGKIIAGIADDYLNNWGLVRGPDFVLNSRCTVKVKTAFYAKDVRLADLMSYWGSVNKSKLPNLGNAAAGTMRLLDIGTDWVYGDDILDADIDLIFDPGGHNNAMQAQQGCWVVQNRPVCVLNANGQLAVDTSVGDKQVLVYVPGKKLAYDGASWSLTDAKAQERTGFPEKDWSLIRALSAW